jgi:putative adenylate-forming enzyme
MNISLLLKLMHSVEQVRKHERWTREQLLAYQSEALRRQRDYAYAHSPFYQHFHKGLMDRPLHELPVLTKAMMMEHYDDLVTDRSIRLDDVRAHAERDTQGARYQGRYWISATSGSSGQPGFFLFNEAEWLAVLTSFARGHEWSGVKINLTHRMKMASVASISAWHMSSQVGASVKSWWMPALRLASTEPLSEIVRKLNEWQPEMLVSYASMARILAEEQVSGRLQIHPHLVYTSSEVLTEETRRRIAEAWGHPPFNQYASTETAEIASECSTGRRMHLYEDFVITEVVDEDYRPVPPGDVGTRLLITTLFSRTQPLIRYELNDRVRLSTEQCSCGLPFASLESIEGRVEDTLYLPARFGGRVAVQPLVFNRIMDILPVSGWQIVQEPNEHLTVLLAGEANHIDDTALTERLAHALAEHGTLVPSIHVAHVINIPKSISGKAPLIQAHRDLPKVEAADKRTHGVSR